VIVFGAKKFGGDVRRLSMLVLVVALAGVALHAQNSSPNASNPDGSKKMDGLLVYGQGFVFSAKEPNGWHADTDKIASYYYSNLIFLPEDKLSQTAHVNIRVRVNHKETKDPSEDMQTDIAGYKTKYPKTQFSDLAVLHPKYKIAAQLFYTPNEYYEYVVYVDPGSGVDKNFSVTMSKESKPATPKEMKAFQEVLASLFWITGTVKTQ
jgi:hypothetical protein